MAAEDNGAMRDDTGRFLPGHPKTPGSGRRKGRRSLTDLLARMLSEQAGRSELDYIYDQLAVPDFVRDDIDVAEDRMEALARYVVHRAVLGDMEWFREIFERLEPKRREISGPGGAPIRAQALGMLAQTDVATAKSEYDSLLENPLDDGEEVEDDA